MHPKKAEMLQRLDETSKVHDAALERSFSVVSNPGEHGWTKSLLTAAVVVPLTGISAVVTDVSHLLLSHSDDDAWDRLLPGSGDMPLPEVEEPPASTTDPL